MDFSKNNLAKASSPYLQQHAEHGIAWQEWNEATLEYAKKEGKLILVSVGYSTCHWCHEMAAGAFSDKAVTEFLNENFVAIKVDREQRPDLDEYFMNFSVRTIGHGGWPLNVVCSPEGHPFFAGTYFPVEKAQGLPGFKEMLGEVKDWYADNKESVGPYKMIVPEEVDLEEDAVLQEMVDAFDEEWGGIGMTNKFPPHSTLLFLLHHFEAYPNEAHRDYVTHTLDAMMDRGLHDHLQGGFYRYCVDREWNLPHFEKMLYDQAMHLWVYSLAYKVFGDERYKAVVQKLVTCLKDTFAEGDAFWSGIDADEDAYMWSLESLRDVLKEGELVAFADLYGVGEEPSHLVKQMDASLPDLEAKVLKARGKPFVDKKILTSWNALTGVGLVMAARYCALPEAGKMADALFKHLMTAHVKDGVVFHSAVAGELGPESYLEDVAALLLLATFMYEEDFEGKETLAWMLEALEKFKVEGRWLSNLGASDFAEVPASSFDHPIPSAVSLAEMAAYRAQQILEAKPEGEAEPTYSQALQQDFHNLMVFWKTGECHELHVPERIDWSDLPANVLLMPGTLFLDCHRKMCKMFPEKGKLLEHFRPEA